MRTVLLFSNVRPTDAGGRAEKFRSRAKRLKQYGWNLEVAYVPKPEFAFPIDFLRALATARQVDPDVVVAVSNPFHLQYVGWLFARTLGVPWVAEFRDPIASNPDREEGSLVTRLAAVTERFTVQRANRCVWFDGIQISGDYFENTYPDDASRVRKLPFLGYDPEAFDVQAAAFDEWTLTYAGSFYDGWIEPDTVLQGIAEYIESTGDNEFRVRFYGDWTDEYERLVDELGLKDVVSAHGFVPHSEIVPVLKGSDAVLYIGGTDPRNHLNIPSKIWDYIGARTPILGVVDPGFRVASFIREYELGVVADETPSDIATAFGTLRDEYQYDPSEQAFDFTRDRLVAAYAEILDEVVP